MQQWSTLKAKVVPILSHREKSPTRLRALWRVDCSRPRRVATPLHTFKTAERLHEKAKGLRLNGYLTLDWSILSLHQVAT